MDHYRLHYRSFPAASQNEERGVKLTNHCAVQNGVNVRDHFTQQQVPKQSRKSKILARELYKPTNWRKSALKEAEIIRTKTKSIALISDTVRNHNEDQFDNTKKMNAKRVLTSETSSYKNQRKDNFLVAFRDHQNVPRLTPHMNETREGVTHPSLLLDRKDFGKMRVAAHRLHIISELQARGITSTEVQLKNFPKLFTRLKEEEGRKDSFEPKTDLENFKYITET